MSGGSSSGSASVAARGIVPFSLGTDTAAGLNNILGLKPTRGAFSNTGVVPACRTLDCVSVFATTNEDAVTIYDVAAARDLTDGLSRAIPTEAKHKSLPAKPRFGIPAKPEFYDDALAEKSLVAAIKQLEAQGATCLPIDFSIFHEVAALLYDGPGVAEHYAAIQAFATAHATLLNSAVRPLIGQLGARPQHHHKLLRDHHVYYRFYRQSR